ncbi:MAG: nuclear transport factor 2 family protein [Phycisphaerales bacterium]
MRRLIAVVVSACAAGCATDPRAPASTAAPAPKSGEAVPAGPAEGPSASEPWRRIGSDLSWRRFELEEIAAGNALERFHDAAARADFAAYFSAWAGESVFLGTDATERWVGREFQEFARPHFEKGRGWTYRPHHRRITVLDEGKTAFFDELLDNDKLGLCRGSGILVKRGEDWKVLQYNLSIPIPNDLAEEFAGRIKAHKPTATP